MTYHPLRRMSISELWAAREHWKATVEASTVGSAMTFAHELWMDAERELRRRGVKIKKGH